MRQGKKNESEKRDLNDCFVLLQISRSWLTFLSMKPSIRPLLPLQPLDKNPVAVVEETAAATRNQVLSPLGRLVDLILFVCGKTMCKDCRQVYIGMVVLPWLQIVWVHPLRWQCYTGENFVSGTVVIDLP